jgi:small-conductance mechanosensitive channel
VLITGKLPDIAGVVVEVTALSTRLRMYDGTHVRLPNSDVFLSEIRNFSASAAKRIEITIFVSYMSDTQKAIKLIRQKLAEVPLVLVEPVPDVYVDILGESGVNLNVWCWAPFTAWFDVKKMLIDQLKVTLQANDIELTIPRRIIYLEKDGKKPFTKETNSAITTNTTTTPNTATTASNPSSSPGVNLEEVIKD